MHVYLPYGSVNVVHNIGNINLTFKFRLVDSLHLPTFRHNLISVSKLTNSSNITVHFYPKYCVLQYLLTKDVIAYGRIHNGLYKLDTNFYPTSVSTLKINQAHTCRIRNKSDSSSYLWHYRLGHISKKVVSHMQEVREHNCIFLV